MLHKGEMTEEPDHRSALHILPNRTRGNPQDWNWTLPSLTGGHLGFMMEEEEEEEDDEGSFTPVRRRWPCVLWELVLMSANEDPRVQQRKHLDTTETKVNAAGRSCCLLLLLLVCCCRQTASSLQTGLCVDLLGALEGGALGSEVVCIRKHSREVCSSGLHMCCRALTILSGTRVEHLPPRSPHTVKRAAHDRVNST
ncbi:hypothetical protein INR49_010320 [Caranx melampygus]|nr:hypothetical protein INR49_010320 [Caranx melampygus]